MSEQCCEVSDQLLFWSDIFAGQVHFLSHALQFVYHATVLEFVYHATVLEFVCHATMLDSLHLEALSSQLKLIEN